MEVIGHHAIGEDLHPTELSEREEQIDQTLFGQLIEQELPPDRPRHTMVNPTRLLDSRPPHAKTLATHPPTSITMNLSPCMNRI
jgi:hypothetical protein